MKGRQLLFRINKAQEYYSSLLDKNVPDIGIGDKRTKKTSPSSVKRPSIFGKYTVDREILILV